MYLVKRKECVLNHWDRNTTINYRKKNFDFVMNKQNNNQFRLWKHFFIDFIKTKEKLHLPKRHAAVSLKFLATIRTLGKTKLTVSLDT